MSLLKKRDLESHKGDHGRVLIVGGSKDFIGAPALAGIAALRAGCDQVVIACPEKVGWAINSIYPDLITKKFEEDFFYFDHVKKIIDLAEDFDAILIGNGLGTDSDTLEFAREICERIQQPKVIDADAIKSLRGGAEIHNAILTPHATEFEVWTEEKVPKQSEERGNLAKKFTKHNITILLKGHTDVIADKDEIKYNKTGNPGMTVAGTGDILAGIAVSLLAQSKDFFNSAYAAAYLNGAIGDVLLRKKGIGFLASDMLELIPEIKNKTRWI